MLLPDYLFHVSDRVVELWEQLNIFAVRDIARRIIDAGYHMTASADWQIYKMRESGMSYEAIQGAVVKLTEKSELEVKRIFENSIIEGYKEDQKIYEAAGVGGIPFGTDTASKQLQVYYEQTNGELRNFTRTTALQGQRAFIEACDEAFMKIKSGLQSYNQAIEQAVDKAAKEGLYVKYPGGRRDTVEVAVRRAVMTGVNRASIQMTIDTCERQGTNYVKISSHLGARIGKTKAANHAGWQGGIYRIKERDKNFFGGLAHFHDKILVKQYPLLEEETGYPSDPTGLGGYNCRHSVSPYIPGIVPDRDDNIDTEKNRKAYEASQEQRGMEREMRTTRRQIEAYKAAKETAKDEELRKLLASAEVKAQNRLNGQLQDYSDFCAKNNIAEQRERLYLAKGDWKKKLEDKGGVRKALSAKPPIEQKYKEVGDIKTDRVKQTFSNITTSKTVLSVAQEKHILDRHPEAFNKVMDNIDTAVSDPDYIFFSENHKDGLANILEIGEHEYILINLRIATDKDPEGHMNAVITARSIGAKTLKRMRKSSKYVLIYEKK